MKTQNLVVVDSHGMHARPATVVVQEANKFNSKCELEYNGNRVNLKSIMGVMSLGMSKDAVFSIFIDGEDENEAIESIVAKLKVEGVAK